MFLGDRRFDDVKKELAEIAGREEVTDGCWMHCWSKGPRRSLPKQRRKPARSVWQTGICNSTGQKTKPQNEKPPFPHRKRLFGHDHKPLHYKAYAWYPHTNLEGKEHGVFLTQINIPFFCQSVNGICAFYRKFLSKKIIFCMFLQNASAHQRHLFLYQGASG